MAIQMLLEPTGRKVSGTWVLELVSGDIGEDAQR